MLGRSIDDLIHNSKDWRDALTKGIRLAGNVATLGLLNLVEGIGDGLATGEWEGAVEGAGGMVGGSIYAPLAKGRAEEAARRGPKPRCEVPDKKGPACFAAGTPLLTPDGAKNVEDFEVGEEVLSVADGDELGRPVIRRVTALSRYTAPLWHLHLRDQIIRVSSEHPFFVWGKGWVPTMELKVGDWMRSHDGRWVMLEDLCEAGVVENVYNLTVEEDHTYFVGRPEWGFDVWAHNGGACPQHRHHSIPKEIQEKLPPKLQKDPDIKGKPGNPNRRPVDADKHINEMHDKTGISPKQTGIYGGKYNYLFHKAIDWLGGYPGIKKEHVLRIRDLLMRFFGE
jgi:hypothetical protein